MTFAQLSQATATNQRFFHRTQSPFNRIQNSMMSIEIHDQGKSQAYAVGSEVKGHNLLPISIRWRSNHVIS